MAVTRCAVVAVDGSIANFIMADPSTDSLLGFTLVPADDDITFEYIWDGDAFVPGPELAARIAAEQAAIEAEAQETE